MNVQSRQFNNSMIKLFQEKIEQLRGRGEQYRYRAFAYERAAQSIRSMEVGLDEIYRRGWLRDLEKIDGIGNRLAHEIEQELKKNNLIKQ